MDVPERFQSAVGDHVKSINDMVNNHLGEVREIDGAWVRHDGPLPLDSTYYNPQYAITKRQWRDWMGGKGRPEPAVGGSVNGDPEGRFCTILAHQHTDGAPAFKARQARIISLAELFWFWGHEYTAHELYSYYVNARRLVLNRPHAWSSKERREMVAGHWGLGAAGKGEFVRD